MKKRNYLLLMMVIMVATNLFGWYGGSDYTPSYQGGGGGGYITPSRFAPVGYTKNTGWDSGDQGHCNGRVTYTHNPSTSTITHQRQSSNTKPRIVQVAR